MNYMPALLLLYFRLHWKIKEKFTPLLEIKDKREKNTFRDNILNCSYRYILRTILDTENRLVGKTVLMNETVSLIILHSNVKRSIKYRITNLKVNTQII